MSSPEPPVVVTWVTPEQVADEVGVPVASAAGDARLVAATDAANAFAYRRRVAAGYSDDPAVLPGPDVGEGTVMFAAALYRLRGATDGWSSFAELPPGTVAQGTLPMIYRLLGVNRPVIA